MTSELDKIRTQLDNCQGLTCMQGRILYDEMLRNMVAMSNAMQNVYGAYDSHLGNSQWQGQSMANALGLQNMFYPPENYQANWTASK